MAETSVANILENLLKPPIELIGVAMRGVPGEERIVLKTNNTVNLGEYLLLAGHRFVENDVLPIRDHLYWFGQHLVNAGYWVFIYTGAGGGPLWTQTKETKEPAVVFYWGRQQTVFNNDRVVPCLIHMDIGAIQLGDSGR